MPILIMSLFGTRKKCLNIFMLLFLGFFSVSAGTLQAQTTGCPDWSICIETDPENCELTEISLNGLQGENIAGLFLDIQVGNPNVTIDASATLAAFQSTDIGMHPWFSSSATVPIAIVGNTIRIKYVATGTNANPYSVTEECLALGTIILDEIETCDDSFDPLITITSSDPFSISPLYLGADIMSATACPTFTLDCPCSQDICPDDWGIRFVETGECDRVRVSVRGLGGEDLAGMTMNINLDPNIPAIDQQATQASYQNSWFATRPWDVNQITFNGNQITVSLVDLSGSYPVQNNDAFLMDIYFEAEPGECYSFSEPTLNFGLSGVRIGDNFGDSERCDLPGLIGSGFETCCESVTLSGNVLRSPAGPACDEGINYGFPGGTVEVSSTTSYFNKTLVTDPDESYTVEVFPNQTYTVRPDYTSDFLDLCGVNSADIDEIRDVILGVIPCFPNLDVANAAADISDDNNNVSTFDILLIQQWILGFPSSSNNDVWRFMTNDDYLIDFAGSPACPGLSVPTYDREDIVPVINSPVTSDFRAIKMGDVDGTCTQCIDPNAIMGGRDIDLIAKWNRERNVLEFSLDDPLLDGITVLAAAVDGFGLRDNAKLSFTSDDELLVSGKGTKGVGMVWTSTEQFGTSLNAHETIMEIEVDPSIQRIEEFNLHLNVGEMMMNGKRYLFNLIVEEKESARKDEEWSIYPNPATEFIHIRSSNGQAQVDMDLEIINTSGQSVYRKVGVNLHKDGNRIAIHELPSGMFILRLHTADKEIQLPFVKIRP